MRAFALANLGSGGREEKTAEKWSRLEEEIGVFIHGVDPVHRTCKTSAVGWDREDGDEMVLRAPGDVGAKPIYPADWIAAREVALRLMFAAPFLPRPIPGPHPDGHVWFWYQHGENRTLELDCLLKGDRPRLAWTVQGPMARRTLEARVSILIPNSVHAAVLDVADSALSIFWEGLQ